MKPRSRKSGQSLIEVLLAVAVVGIALTALVSVVTASLGRNREATERAIATRLAQEAVEAFRVGRDYNGWDTFYNRLTTLDLDANGKVSLCVGEDEVDAAVGVDTLFPGPDQDWTSTDILNDAALKDVRDGVRMCGQTYTGQEAVGFQRGVFVDLIDEGPPIQEWFNYSVVVDWPGSGDGNYVVVSGTLNNLQGT